MKIQRARKSTMHESFEQLYGFGNLFSIFSVVSTFLGYWSVWFRQGVYFGGGHFIGILSGHCSIFNVLSSLELKMKDELIIFSYCQLNTVGLGRSRVEQGEKMVIDVRNQHLCMNMYALWKFCFLSNSVFPLA